MRLRRLLAGGACALVAAVAAPSAVAHATLEGSDPADGAVLAEGPREVHLRFTESIVPRFSGATISSPGGRVFGSHAVRVAAGGRELTLTILEDLERGLYTVDWKVLSAEDGHVRRGLVVFGVGAGLAPSPAGQRGGDTVGAGDVLLRWLNLTVLAALVGGLAVVAFVLTPSSAGAPATLLRARTRVLGWTIASAAVGLAVGVGILLWQADALAADLDGRGSTLAVARDLLSETRLGALWVAHEVLLLALLGALLLVRRRGVPGVGLAYAGLLVVALVVVQALAGHAAAISPRSGVAVVAASVHILSAGVWMGGLAAAIVAFWPLGRDRAEVGDLVRASLRRFGVLAAVSVGLLVATGLYYAARQVASLDALLTTLYGRALLAKTALVLGAGLIGFLNAMLLRPELATPLARLLGRPSGWTPFTPRLRSFLLAETLVGLAVLAAAGVLTAALPARGPEFAPMPRASEAQFSSRSTSTDDLVVTLAAKPNRAGHNVFQAFVGSTQRPPPAEIGDVELRFRRGAETTAAVPMVETEPGRYRAAGRYLSAPGAWQVDVVVKRPGLDTTVAALDWRTGPPASRAVLVSSRPLGGPLTAASVLVLLVLGVAAAVTLRTTTWRRRAGAWETGPLGSA